MAIVLEIGTDPITDAIVRAKMLPDGMGIYIGYSPCPCGWWPDLTPEHIREHNAKAAAQQEEAPT